MSFNNKDNSNNLQQFGVFYYNNSLPYTSSKQDLHPPQDFSSRDSPMHSVKVYTFELYQQIVKSSLAPYIGNWGLSNSI